MGSARAACAGVRVELARASRNLATTLAALSAFACHEACAAVRCERCDASRAAVRVVRALQTCLPRARRAGVPALRRAL